MWSSLIDVSAVPIPLGMQHTYCCHPTATSLLLSCLDDQKRVYESVCMELICSKDNSSTGVNKFKKVRCPGREALDNRLTKGTEFSEEKSNRRIWKLETLTFKNCVFCNGNTKPCGRAQHPILAWLNILTMHSLLWLAGRNSAFLFTFSVV